MTHTNPTRSRRVTVLLSPDELAIADELARAQGVSRSDVLRQPLYAQRPRPTGARGEGRAEEISLRSLCADSHPMKAAQRGLW